MPLLLRLIGEDITLDRRSDPGLPPVKADPTQLEQILLNLCANARDAIRGNGHIVIYTGNARLKDAECFGQSEKVSGEYVLLSVTDDGCGMDEDTLNNVFEPFFTTKETGDGTGLGLATVYGIVEQNGGFVRVQSVLGRGSSFEIYLPRCPAGECGEAVRSTPAANLPFRETILLVEDESALLMLTQKILEDEGYRVLTAVCPGEALKIAEEYVGSIDLLLSDVIMPEMNGRVLAQEIGLCRPNTKCLLMSGYTADAISDRGILASDVKLLRKPFRKSELYRAVRSVLDENS